jgi:GR25 family glycosyltransferase involved in LPS biosynthesis
MGTFRRLIMAVMCLAVVLFVLTGVIFARNVHNRADKIDLRDLKEFPIDNTIVDTLSMPEHVVCINLPYREDAWEDVHKQFKKHLISCTRLIATIGHYLPPTLFKGKGVITDRLVNHLENNPNHRGHLGALFSHKEIYFQMIEGQWGMTLIVEDDVVLSDNFRQDMSDRIAALEKYDPLWEILLLGFSCDVGGCIQCEKNQKHITPVTKGIVKIGYFIGLWAYIVRDHVVAKRIHNVKHDWMIDHAMNNMDLNIYGCIPSIGQHPGSSRISAWDYTHITRRPKGRTQYVSDCTQ